MSADLTKILANYVKATMQKEKLAFKNQTSQQSTLDSGGTMV